ncbi:MAG TPA: MarR family transcriptional regulator [Devosiaceae bacterium]
MSTHPDPLNLDNMLCFAIYAAGHAFNRFYKPRLDALGLTYPQYLVFLVLWEQDGLTVKALGERLFLDSGTVTPLLKRLEARGWLERRRDEEDERQVRVVLTQAGRDLREKALSVPLAVADATALEYAAVEQLQSGLRDLKRRLDAH